jgi:hypothetical protein
MAAKKKAVEELKFFYSSSHISNSKMTMEIKDPEIRLHKME